MQLIFWNQLEMKLLGWRTIRCYRNSGMCFLMRFQIFLQRGTFGFHYWTCTRISTSVQGTLHNEYTRDARVEDATARFVGKEVYPTECVSLGSTDSVCEKERWYTQVVYLLQRVEQGYCEEYSIIYLKLMTFFIKWEEKRYFPRLTWGLVTIR